MYTLDTNAIIYYLSGQDAAYEQLKSIFASNATLYLSAISEIELLSLPSLRPDEFLGIGRFTNRLVSVPVDSRVARIASTIRRRASIKTPDAAIAATALMTGTTLLTRNVRDFERVPNLAIEPI